MPRQLARWLAAEGHDAVHAMDLPDGNRTADPQITALSVLEQRVVVTKDNGFVDTFLVRRAPYKLLLISTGNISNRAMLQLFEHNLERVVRALEAVDFVELGRESLISRQ